MLTGHSIIINAIDTQYLKALTKLCKTDEGILIEAGIEIEY
jgi:hypothetical protein